MGLQIIKDGGTGNTVEVNARLYRTEDGRVVREGHAAARWLYATPGRRIPRAEAKKLGLLRNGQARTPAKKAASSGNKQGRQSANKQQKPAEDK